MFAPRLAYQKTETNKKKISIIYDCRKFLLYEIASIIFFKSEFIYVLSFFLVSPVIISPVVQDKTEIARFRPV